jgi:HPt (histidine-containing phosphotransfer) domain-containing protein
MECDLAKPPATASANQPVEQQAPLEYDTLLANCSGDMQLIRELSALFETQTQLDIAGIERAAAEADSDGLRSAAHSLKGSAGCIAAQPLRKLAQLIEELGKSGSTQGTQDIIADARREVERCIRFLATRTRLESNPQAA